MDVRNSFWIKFGIFTAIVAVINVGRAELFSNEGLVQNVQNYSANPFYNVASGTVTKPKMVYVNGPKLSPSDCERAVQSIVEDVCSYENNCMDTKLSSVRPDIMVKLSLLPGYNYATSCNGYIDGVYDTYVKRVNYMNNTVINPGFLNDVPRSIAGAVTTTQKPSLPKWQQEYNERAAELKALQAMTAEPIGIDENAEFPTTLADMSFQERNRIKSQGYEPYEDKKAYVPLEHIEKEASLYKTTEEVQSKAYADFIECLKPYEAELKSAYSEFMAACVAKNDRTALETWANNIITPVEAALAAYTPPLSIADVCDEPNFTTWYDRTRDIKNYPRAGQIQHNRVPTTEPANRYVQPESAANLYFEAKLAKKVLTGDPTANYNNAKKRLNDAIKADHHSPCLCTSGKRFRGEALKIMGIRCQAETGVGSDLNAAPEPAKVS